MVRAGYIFLVLYKQKLDMVV